MKTYTLTRINVTFPFLLRQFVSAVIESNFVSYLSQIRNEVTLYDVLITNPKLVLFGWLKLEAITFSPIYEIAN